jgi:hypothetical protein
VTVALAVVDLAVAEINKVVATVETLHSEMSLQAVVEEVCAAVWVELLDLVERRPEQVLSTEVLVAQQIAEQAVMATRSALPEQASVSVPAVVVVATTTAAWAVLAGVERVRHRVNTNVVLLVETCSQMVLMRKTHREHHTMVATSIAATAVAVPIKRPPVEPADQVLCTCATSQNQVSPGPRVQQKSSARTSRCRFLQRLVQPQRTALHINGVKMEATLMALLARR